MGYFIEESKDRPKAVAFIITHKWHWGRVFSSMSIIAKTMTNSAEVKEFFNSAPSEYPKSIQKLLAPEKKNCRPVLLLLNKGGAHFDMRPC